MSPFAAGGLNAYAYCQGDPVNFQDPSGQMMSGRPSRWGPPKKLPDFYAGYKLIGFHGSSSKHMDSLVKGPQKRFLERSKYGVGFYATPISKLARNFANEFEKGGRRYMGTYEVAGESKPSYGKVYSVYARNTESWKEGVHYSYQDNIKLVIDSSVFSDVMISKRAAMDVTDIRTGKNYVYPASPSEAGSSSTS